MNCNEPIRETSKLETQCEAMCEQMDLISEKLTGLRSLLQPVLVEKDRTGAAEQAQVDSSASRVSRLLQQATRQAQLIEAQIGDLYADLEI